MSVSKECRPKFLQLYNHLMYIEHRTVIPCSSRIWFLLFPKSNALLKGCCHSAIPSIYSKIPHESEKKNNVVKKCHILRKICSDMRLPMGVILLEIFLIYLNALRQN